jgi:tetratricopeptide (TPR) repeat protein
MSTVCLAVMAKNEAHVIARCLASAKPLIDTWLVLDTGSTDATREVARETMQGVPGEVIDRPWRGFAGSRKESFELARPRADYTLVLDADDVFEYPPRARFPELTEAGYAFIVHDGPIQLPRIMLFDNKVDWDFEGIIHECATCPSAGQPAFIAGIICRRLGGGARDSDPQKFLKDAAILEEELRQGPPNPRSVFYLARSYEDAGELPRALAAYERRVSLGGWNEEVFYSAYAAARVREKLGARRDEVERAFLEAWRLRPRRAEPLFELARVARFAEDWTNARAYAAAAMAIPRPSDVLSIHHEIYSWRALNEYAGACVHLGDHAAAMGAMRAMLAGDALPVEDRVRIEANLAMCVVASAESQGRAATSSPR